MSVLSRRALEESPLADLHALASELGIDGFRRLRKAALVDTILEAQGGEPAPDEDAPATVEAAAPSSESDAESEADGDDERPRRRSRGGRTRTRRTRDADDGSEPAGADEPEEAPAKRARAPRSRKPAAAAAPEAEAEAEDRVVEGVVELLGNGSGFLRLNPPEPSDDDVYVSAAQVRRCELVSGDRVAGPVRAPRRSERHPSLVRVDTINGRAADEVAEGTHFDDLPAAYPTKRLALDGEDPTLKAIEWLTPLGRGSRAVITGPARSGKTEALARIAAALGGQDGLDVTVVLAGVRPEEITAWKQGKVEPVSALSFAASPDAQTQAVERAVETARRLAARGGDAVVLIDSLDGVHPAAARKVLAAARDIVDGGSLTIVATASAPLGGETTVITLDPALTSTGRFPALDLTASGTVRPELLVGDAGADAIAQARASALGA